MQAQMGSRSSWAWASLMEGRAVLKEKGIWSLGNGHTIRPFQDPWVPLIPGFRIRPRREDAQTDGNTVAEWMNTDDSGWREDLVRAAVHDEDVSSILTITIPVSRPPDTLQWPHSQDGRITVRSAYHCIHEDHVTNEVNLNRTAQVDLPLVWSAIWKSDVWPKMKAFMWNIATNTLPTQLTLSTRGMPIHPLCPLCHVEESREHVFFGCPWATQVWRHHMSHLGIAMGRESMDQWLEWAVRGPLWSRFMIVCWLIWKSRCTFVFEGRCPHVSSIL